MKQLYKDIKEVIKLFKAKRLGNDKSFVTPLEINVEDVEAQIKNEFIEITSSLHFLKSSEKSDIIKHITQESWGWKYIDLGRITEYTAQNKTKHWNDRNLQDVKFWKDVVLNNASINNEPHKVANEALNELKKRFKA